MAGSDQRLANEAAAADQCMKLGAVLLKEPRAHAGFAAPAPPRPQELREPQHHHNNRP